MNSLVPIFLHITVLNVTLKNRNLFLSSKPASHLWYLISEVGCFPALRGHINMETLEHFRVVVICRTKILDGFHIMNHGVKLWYIQVLSNPKVNQNVLVFVEKDQSILHIV